jgi:DNA topoisomerase-3
MSVRLVLAEKPSVAAGIAAVLGAKTRKEGYFEGNGYIVGYCYGHLLGLAAPDAYGERYAKWRYADLPIVPETWLHTPSKDKAAQLKILKELLTRADAEYIVNACDAGREGELIFRLVYEYSKSTAPIRRLWISSMEEAAIREGFENLKDGAEYDNLYAAASCRERADWTVGINMTRLWSCLYGSTLNCGRVQSPTLAMLVKREDGIANFSGEPFYTPTLDLSGFAASGDKLKDKTAADEIAAACSGQSASVTDVERVTKTVAPPKLYDLTGLQREANRLLGYTAQQTLDCAQSLYEKAYISYPRTDSRFLTSDMAAGLPRLVNLIALNIPGVRVPLDVNADTVINDGKVSDHHAIVPTEASCKADLSALPSGERAVYNLVAVRLIAATAPKHVYESVTVTFDCGGNTFIAKGKTVAEDGWKAIEDAFRAGLKDSPDSGDEADEADEGSEALPELSKGRVFSDVAVSVKEGCTKPKPHHTDASILSAMENAGAEDFREIDGETERRGLGTSATRAAVLETLVKRGFAVRSKKNLLPNDKGNNLIAVLPNSLTSAKLTAEWEGKLLRVQRGELDADEFTESIAAFVKSIVLSNSKPNPDFISLFPSDKKNAAPSLGKCPRCASDVREGQKGFFCDSRACGFRLWKESRFWTAKKKPLTAAIVGKLLNEGKVALKDLRSEKTGKTYGATVFLDDNGGQYVNFRMEFEKAGAKK